MRPITFWITSTLALFLIIQTACARQGQVEWRPELTEDWTPVSDSVYTTGHFAEPPSDAIILFDGTGLSQWESAPGYFPSIRGVSDYLNALSNEYGDAEWDVENGIMTVVPGAGNIKTKQSFGDIHLHIEWRTPEEVEGSGQGRGNSGVFLMGLYEIQVLDSWQNPTYSNGQAGAIYKQKPPAVNASRAPGEWQSYDIFFEAPRFDEDGELIKAAYITVMHNGILIHHREKLEGPTVYIGLSHYEPHAPMLPIGLQDHDDYVSFRNIWVREL
ncbi:DUF1080 domain-containing protein [Rhodohalobacter mucosus]|uniref:DUF1080 domain-containing protein n=1 Tax=Rhodohalobacter mucosus TaxID=2079485 RepID=A0A316U009_9BACT|nr:DUF1080 domain-containing protein [Rhodohalobacter mucosus]